MNWIIGLTIIVGVVVILTLPSFLTLSGNNKATQPSYIVSPERKSVICDVNNYFDVDDPSTIECICPSKFEMKLQMRGFEPCGTEPCLPQMADPAYRCTPVDIDDHQQARQEWTDSCRERCGYEQTGYTDEYERCFAPCTQQFEY
jgi:hypothetical protein